MFFFKQKTAYEMRISDWSSDVCSSDLPNEERDSGVLHPFYHLPRRDLCLRYHRGTSGGSSAGGGRNALSTAYPTEEQRVAQLQLGRIRFRATKKILLSFPGRNRGIGETGRHLEGTDLCREHDYRKEPINR